MDRTAEIFKMELELAKVSNRLKLATHAANIGIWEVDIESGLLECNEVMFKLYGVENNETLKYYKSWMELIHPVDRKKFLDNFMLAFEGKKPLKLEFRTIWKDGTIHFIKSESVIVRNSEGKVMKLIGTNLDITNEMQYELELLKAKEQAEIANGLKSQFLANMSHEIRTPMNGIIGFLDLLQFTKLTYEQVEYVKEAKIASTMLLHLINDILDFSKIEAGKIIMEDDAFNLRKTVDDVVSMLYPRAKEKNIDIFVNINENVPDSLSGDAIRLKQVLNNLIVNAIKFTHKGKIDIIVSLNKIKNGLVSVGFIIKDTGIGISEENQKKLFMPFVQADTSTTKSFGGTGLGLIISKKIVNLMGGDIELESEFLKGSTFKFSVILKITGNLKKSKDENEMEEDYGIIDNKPNILLVEDNETNRMILIKMLKHKNYCCDVASDGMEAIQAVQKKDYDIIFMDCQMPKLNGYEATKKIRELQGNNKHSTIIAMTAAAMAGDKERCIEAGMDEYISKPINFNEVYRLIEENI